MTWVFREVLIKKCIIIIIVVIINLHFKKCVQRHEMFGITYVMMYDVETVNTSQDSNTTLETQRNI